MPAIREDSDRNDIYVSMLMLYTKCYEDILDNVVEEKKMIQLLGTHRGKNLLTWQSSVVPKVTNRVIVPSNRKNIPVESFVDAVLEHRSMAVTAANTAHLSGTGLNLNSPATTATSKTKLKPLPTISNSNLIPSKTGATSSKSRNSHLILGSSTDASGVKLTTNMKQLTEAANKTWKRQEGSNDKFNNVTRRTVVASTPGAGGGK